MVRVIGGDIGDGAPGRNVVEIAGGYPVALESGDVIITAHTVTLFDVGDDEREVSTGEWIYVDTYGGGGYTQTLPMIREYYFATWILIPLALLVGFQSIMRAIKR